jgi:uncharacterized protein YciI
MFRSECRHGSHAGDGLIETIEQRLADSDHHVVGIQYLKNFDHLLQTGRLPEITGQINRLSG